MEEILVSVVCTAYNHENYIREALEGFIKQKTNFKFEVLVHDDASTDKTADIIREYEQKYPDMIKGIYQTENQYSKGVKILFKYLFPAARGKYFAWCEGDDFWSYKYKLQEQVDYMEAHPECAICCHAANLVNEQGNIITKLRPYSRSTTFNIETFFDRQVNYPTASLMLTNKIKNKCPDFYKNAPVGDIPITLYCLTKGNGYYIDKIMSSYRTGVDSSWTSTHRTPEKKIHHYEQMKQMYIEFQEYTKYKYKDIINKHIDILDMYTLISSKKEKEAKKKYPQYYKKRKLCGKIKYKIRRLLGR